MELNDLFGKHTFFLDRNGLNIVEPAEPAGAAAQSATVVNLASWSEDNRSGLELHEPEATDVSSRLDSSMIISPLRGDIRGRRGNASGTTVFRTVGYGSALNRLEMILDGIKNPTSHTVS